MGLNWMVRRRKPKPDSAPRYMTPLQAAKIKEQQEEKKGDQEQKDEKDEKDDDDNYETLAFERIGTYSAIHHLRRAWVDAALELAKVNGWIDVQQTLRQWMQPPSLMDTLMLRTSEDPLIQACLRMGMSPRKMLSSNGITNGRVPVDEDDPSVRTLARQGLLGLWRLVQHSDCDGEYTAAEAKDILETYNLLKKHIAPNTIQWCEDTVVSVLKASVKHGLPIEFC